MATDKTWFDEKLKSNLFLDIGFRVIIWFAISLIALSHASRSADFSPVVAFQRSMEGLLPVISDVTRLAFVMCVGALMLKDLEHVAPARWDQSTTIGKLGGVIRRLGGDLSTWILGALITLLASFLMFATFIHTTGNWSKGAISLVTTFAIFFAVGIPIFSVANVWIRRDVSLVSSHATFVALFNTPLKVLAFYSILALVVYVSA